MLDPVFEFFNSVFKTIGRIIGKFFVLLFWPFVTFRNWLRGRGWFIKIPVFIILIVQSNIALNNLKAAQENNWLRENATHQPW